MTPAANYYGLLTIYSAAALSATKLIPLLPRKPLNAEDDLTATLIIICVIQSVLGPAQVHWSNSARQAKSFFKVRQVGERRNDFLRRLRPKQGLKVWKS